MPIQKQVALSASVPAETTKAHQSSTEPTKERGERKHEATMIDEDEYLAAVLLTNMMSKRKKPTTSPAASTAWANPTLAAVALALVQRGDAEPDNGQVNEAQSRCERQRPLGKARPGRRRPAVFVWEHKTEAGEWQRVHFMCTTSSVVGCVAKAISNCHRPQHKLYNTALGTLVRLTTPDQWRTSALPYGVVRSGTTLSTLKETEACLNEQLALENDKVQNKEQQKRA